MTKTRDQLEHEIYWTGLDAKHSDTELRRQVAQQRLDRLELELVHLEDAIEDEVAA